MTSCLLVNTLASTTAVSFASVPEFTKNDFLSKNDFNSEEIIQHTKEKLKKYFDNYTEINGQLSEDEHECFKHLDKVFIENNIEKMDILRNMVLENEERIYNQVKYYWI